MFGSDLQVPGGTSVYPLITVMIGPRELKHKMHPEDRYERLSKGSKPWLLTSWRSDQMVRPQNEDTKDRPTLGKTATESTE
jgi:hypothetical protein